MRERCEAIPDFSHLIQWLNRCLNYSELPLWFRLLQLQHLYSKCVVHYQERDSLGILITYTHSKDVVLNRLTIWGEFINELRTGLSQLWSDIIHHKIIVITGDRALPDIKILYLQHVYTTSVRLIVWSIQISEINGRLAILINFLKYILVIHIFIRSNHGYLREVSLVLIPEVALFGGSKVIYQNGFLDLQDQHILVLTFLLPGLLWYL
jgi:hypothetical protein